MAGANPVVGDIVEIEVVIQVGSQIGVNLHHYLVGAATGPNPSLLDIADAVDNIIAVPYKNAISTFATYKGVGATNLSGARTLQYTSVTRAGTGSGGSTLLPTQIRGLISWYGGLAGRQYRGRTYVPFPSQTAEDVSGNPTGAYTTVLGILRNAIFTPITVTSGGGSCTLRHGIFHRKAPVPYLSETVFAFTRNKFATQRRSGAFGKTNTSPF